MSMKSDRINKDATALSGNWRKRGSFQPLIDRIEARHQEANPVSGAAFRAALLIRMMRKAAGLSQGQLGKELGMSQARVSELEAGAGSQGPSWSLMGRVADACGATILISPGDSDIAVDAAAPLDAGQQRLVEALG